ncbi:zinc ribbon domain-containing protein [Bacillus cereus]|uniref:zinc ribbon domain-containing protein n=1 Tax=Bacillus cereus TaxID=1396 RepID=UPI0009AF37DC|nr:zinc ribbon domain-containing protein [Bacillus cereus]
MEYKVKWDSKEIIEGSKTFTSSQLCSSYEYNNIDAKDRTIRECNYPSCLIHHDRDRNGALNPRNKVIRHLTVVITRMNYNELEIVRLLFLRNSHFKQS